MSLISTLSTFEVLYYYYYYIRLMAFFQDSLCKLAPFGFN